MDWKLVLLLALAAGAQANFNAAEGFSGRVADCTSCHADPHPFDDNARLVVGGLPDVWEPDATYLVEVTIEDGPMARDGLPQGGFDAEFSAGSVASIDGLTHAYYDRGMTYTVDGAMVRAWSFTWTAPDLSVRPVSISVWVAGMAADGGHVQALGTGDQSEKYDSVDTFNVQIPPSAAALQAWTDMPLVAPAWNATANGFEGRHMDGNATHLAWRTDDTWHRRATGELWRITPPETGPLWIRSEGADRVSPEVQILTASGQPPAPSAPAENAPVPFVLPAILFALLWRKP